jgi:hypothetical protein
MGESGIEVEIHVKPFLPRLPVHSRYLNQNLLLNLNIRGRVV